MGVTSQRPMSGARSSALASPPRTSTRSGTCTTMSSGGSASSYLRWGRGRGKGTHCIVSPTLGTSSVCTCVCVCVVCVCMHAGSHLPLLSSHPTLPPSPPQLTTLELQCVSPKLLECRDLELAVPGTYSPASQTVSNQQVLPTLQVITSKQQLRKLRICGGCHCT